MAENSLLLTHSLPSQLLICFSSGGCSVSWGLCLRFKEGGCSGSWGSRSRFEEDGSKDMFVVVMYVC